MKAFVAYFNSTSSICGRKLSLTLGDSQTSESGDQQATTSACGSSFAMVGSMGAFDGGGTQAVEHCGIPDLRTAVTESVRYQAPEVFAAFDGFEQERFAGAPDFAIGRERRFNVRKQPARDGNEISLRGQLQKFI